MELKDCFRENFLDWLAKSNHPKIKNWNGIEGTLNHLKHLKMVREESLREILDILLREPLADYFWYGYPEYGGELSYFQNGVDVTKKTILPQFPPVPGDALRVDKEKIKIFLRDIKIETLLQ